MDELLFSGTYVIGLAFGIYSHHHSRQLLPNKQCLFWPSTRAEMYSMEWSIKVRAIPNITMYTICMCFQVGHQEEFTVGKIIQESTAPSSVTNRHNSV